MLTLAPNNDNLIVIQNVVDFLTGPIADMAATLTIYDETDNTILSGCNALTVNYTTTYNGLACYYVVIAKTVQIVDNTKYRAVLQSSNYGVYRELLLLGKRMLTQ